MDITKALNREILGHEVMKRQAGNRFIVTIHTKAKNEDYTMNRTSHYENYAELDTELEKLEKQGYTISWSSNRASELLKTKDN